eukprot:RCo022328
MILAAPETGLLLRLLVAWYGYQTYLSVENGESRFNSNWLVFWMVFAAFQLVEFLPDLLLGWFPFYFEAKLAAYVYLGLYGGAAKLYESHLRKSVFEPVHAQVSKALAHPSVYKFNAMLKEKTGISLPCLAGAGVAAFPAEFSTTMPMSMPTAMPGFPTQTEAFPTAPLPPGVPAGEATYYTAPTGEKFVLYDGKAHSLGGGPSM